jgi:uncharacterized iron-regulated protein
MRAGLVCVSILTAACGARQGTTTTPKRGIEAAALPFHVLDRSGHQIDEATFWSKLESERAVCVGEEHTNPHHHWVQLDVVRHLAHNWHDFALGMEMVGRPFQGALDDFAAHKIDDAALQSRTGWSDRWGYDYSFYGPTIHAAVVAHGALLALNAPKELTKKVVHHGLESLTPDEKAQVPQLDLDDKAHRAWFDALMEDMGGSEAHSHKPEEAKPGEAKPSREHTDGGEGSGAEPEMPSADRIYTVQVIWDETMADTAATWLKSHPDGHVIILAGGGHCHDSAIVNRIKRRGIADVVSIHPVIDDGEGAVADAMAKPMNDFYVVLTMPPGVEKAPPKSDSP